MERDIHFEEWKQALFPPDLKRIRQSLGMSQTTIAMILGTTSSTVSRWENSGQMPNHRSLCFYQLFDQFSKKHVLVKGDVKRMILVDGLPSAIYHLLDTIYKNLEEKEEGVADVTDEF